MIPYQRIYVSIANQRAQYIFLRKCGIQYIRQTCNNINEQIRGHMADIRAGNVAKPVSRHFTANQHTLNDV